MCLALSSDIHGNLSTLETVLADIRSTNVERVEMRRVPLPLEDMKRDALLSGLLHVEWWLSAWRDPTNL